MKLDASTLKLLERIYSKIGCEFGTIEFATANSTKETFGAIDDISLPLGKYFYAYSDDNGGLPTPMLCLDLIEDMYEGCIVGSKEVMIWQIDRTENNSDLNKCSNETSPKPSSEKSSDMSRIKELFDKLLESKIVCVLFSEIDNFISYCKEHGCNPQGGCYSKSELGFFNGQFFYI